jgi:hypothetical protein
VRPMMPYGAAEINFSHPAARKEGSAENTSIVSTKNSVVYPAWNDRSLVGIVVRSILLKMCRHGGTVSKVGIYPRS